MTDSVTSHPPEPAADEAPRVDLEHLPFTLDEGVGAAARIGLIVLSTDGTVEQEFRQVLASLPDVALFQSRIWNDAAITPETLKAMEARIPDCAKVILPGAALDCLAYGCTSASMVIGPERVRDLLLEARGPKTATNPALAALAAFQALSLRRIALLTPYLPSVNRMLRGFFQSRGIQVPVFQRGRRPDRGPDRQRLDSCGGRAAGRGAGCRRAFRVLYLGSSGRVGCRDRSGGRQARHLLEPCLGLACLASLGGGGRPAATRRTLSLRTGLERGRAGSKRLRFTTSFYCEVLPPA